MKRLIFIVFLSFGTTIIAHQANAQLWNRIKKEVRNRAKNHVVNDAGDVTDRTIDETEDAAINSIKKANQNDHSNLSNQEQQTAVPSTTTVGALQSIAVTASSPLPATTASYKNHDFVPGNKVIFKTAFTNQQDAELPARLGTLDGTAEIQTYKGQKVQHIEKGNRVCIVPMIDSANYLPGQFTVEFDFLYHAPDPGSFNQIAVNFYQSDKNNDCTSFLNPWVPLTKCSACLKIIPI